MSEPDPWRDRYYEAEIRHLRELRVEDAKQIALQTKTLAENVGKRQGVLSVGAVIAYVVGVAGGLVALAAFIMRNQ